MTAWDYLLVFAMAVVVGAASGAAVTIVVIALKEAVRWIRGW